MIEHTRHRRSLAWLLAALIPGCASATASETSAVPPTTPAQATPAPRASADDPGADSPTPATASDPGEPPDPVAPPESGAPWVTMASAAATSPTGIVWQPFSEELMAAARSVGRPVFLQYSAEWCKPCEVHEREYFSKEDIRQHFSESGVLPVKADMTEQNDLMEEWIIRLSRMSLPTYAVYYPDGSTDVLPMQLTRKSLVAALERARAR